MSISNLQQVLNFKVGDYGYCIDTNDIMQILRVPQFTKIPMTDINIRGICPIEGSVVMILDSKSLITKQKNFIDEKNDKSRILTLKGKDNHLIALLVEEVAANIQVDHENLEYTETDDDDPVIAVMKSNNDIVQILSIEKLLNRLSMPKFDKEDVNDLSKSSEFGVRKITSERKFLFFKMGAEIYAIDIECVREVIFATTDVTKIADAPKEVLGMFTLRNKVLVSLDFRKHFDIEGFDSEQNRIIIVQYGKKAIGLLVDGIIDIKDVEISKIEEFPNHGEEDKLSGVTKLSDKLVSIIKNSSLHQLIEQTKTTDEENIELGEQKKKSSDECGENMELVVFRLNKEEYAFDIEDVEEIIRHTDITIVSDAPKYVKGIINLRGSVIPIFSLHERLGFPEKIDEDTKILVCRIHDTKTGFLVDNVSEVLTVPANAIVQSGEKDMMFSNVIVLDNGKRMILKLSASKIIESS